MFIDRERERERERRERERERKREEREREREVRERGRVRERRIEYLAGSYYYNEMRIASVFSRIQYFSVDPRFNSDISVLKHLEFAV